MRLDELNVGDVLALEFRRFVFLKKHVFAQIVHKSDESAFYISVLEIKNIDGSNYLNSVIYFLPVVPENIIPFIVDIMREQDVSEKSIKEYERWSECKARGQCGIFVIPILTVLKNIQKIAISSGLDKAKTVMSTFPEKSSDGDYKNMKVNFSK